MTAISGFLIYFGSTSDRDLEGDYFNAQTDFDLTSRRELSLYFEHGMDSVIGRRRIGRGLITPQREGLWIDAQAVPELPARIWNSLMAMAHEGELGFSSGAPAHLVEREEGWIKRWPLIDASLTATPAEPRCIANVNPAKALSARAERLQRDYVHHLRAINETRLWLLEKAHAY